MFNMIIMYGEADCSALRAKQLYAERYPHLRQPSRQFIVNLCETLHTTGSFFPRIEGRGPRRNIDREVEILEHIHNNSARSTRSIAREMGLSHTYVHRTLRDEGL